jgi:riboflavin transporter FmnP
MLSALAAILEIFPVEIPFPLFPRLTVDPVGIPIAVAAILYGPSAGLIASGIAGAAITLRGNAIGASFKVVAEVSTSVPLALTLYALRGHLSKGGRRAWVAVGLSWAVAVTSRIAVMTVDNYLFLQVLLSFPVELVLALLPIIAIFNLLQGIINVVPAYLVVHRLPPDLKPEWLPQVRT